MLYFESFRLAFKTTLDRFAPLKQNAARNNNQPLMTRTLRKTIMKKSKLRYKFSKERNEKNWSDYKQKRNYYSNLLEEFITRYFNNLKVKDVTENKPFLKAIKPFSIGKTKKLITF